MANRDRFGHVIPKMEKEIMAHFDTTIRGDFGNTPAILLEASKDLAADNQAAAAEDYGRGVSLHESCDYREAKLKSQIGRLIVWGDRLARGSYPNNQDAEYWNYEVSLARELIK